MARSNDSDRESHRTVVPERYAGQVTGFERQAVHEVVVKLYTYAGRVGDRDVPALPPQGGLENAVVVALVGF